MRKKSLANFAWAALLCLACGGGEAGPGGGISAFAGSGTNGSDPSRDGVEGDPGNASADDGDPGNASAGGSTDADPGSGGSGAGNSESGVGDVTGIGNAGGTESGSAGTDGASVPDDAEPTDATLEWLPSWATTIQSTEPNNLPPALGNNTLRQFVWPTIPGQQIRIQLSNEKGSGPVQIQKVHIALARTEGNPGNGNGQIDAGTDVSFAFNGMAGVTIPAGATVWSDALDFNLEDVRLTAISMQFGGSVPPEITGHPGARTTSYIATGDSVSQPALAGAQTRDRWYFINAIEVMAPSDAFAIAVLGDSITDGYGVLNQFGRWPDFLTLAIANDAQLAGKRSVLNFGMGANNLTVSGQYQDSGVVRFGRDVLTRDKIKWLVVLEGINDIVYSNVAAQPIINAYRQIVQRAHEAGILVYGSPITPTAQGNTAIRAEVNQWIRTSGEFDAIIDLEAAIRDPGNANAILAMFNNDGLHPNVTGYQAMGNAVDLSLFYQPMSN